MNHIQLHRLLSETLLELKKGKIEPQMAKTIFNGAGKIIQNARNEIIAANMGVPIEIPLLGISKRESVKLNTGTKFISV